MIRLRHPFLWDFQVKNLMAKFPAKCLTHCLIQFALLAICLAQNVDRATLSGRVVDESNAAIPGASILLQNDDTGHTRETVSGETGTFSLPFLPAGSYALIAESKGFARLSTTGIRLGANQTLELNLVLKVGPVSTQISVTAAPNRIDTTTSTVRHEIVDRELKELPFLVERFGLRGVLYMLPLLVPGANSLDSLALRSPGGLGGRVSINGSPAGTIGFTFDGTDNYSGEGAVTRGPNPDALGEFSALTHTFKAESGNYPTIINLQTKGGGNHFHGQVRGIYRDPRLDARDFFSLVDSAGLITRVAGFQLSGPVRLPKIYQGRNRTFFFIDVERSRWKFAHTDRQPVINNFQRQGDFSRLPVQRWPKDPLTGVAFPNGRIPEDRILPQSRFYIDELIPRANEGNDWVRTVERKENGTQLVLRFDHQISSRDTVNLSLFSENTAADFPFYAAEFEGRARARNLAVHYVHSFSATMTESFTFGTSQRVSRETVVGRLKDVDPAQYGFNIGQDGQAWLPDVYLPATNGFEGGRTSRFETKIWSLRNDLAIVQATHALKFGGDARWRRSLILSPSAPRFTFTDQNPYGSGNEIANLLLGIPTSYEQSTPLLDRPHRFLTALYAQDDFKLKGQMLLNLGLRYELSGVWSDSYGRNAFFRPGIQSAVFPNAPPGVLFPGDTDPWSGSKLRVGTNPPDHNNFAPRIGLAFSPDVKREFLRKVLGSVGTSSIRLGYGFYFYPNRGVFGPNAAVPPWSYGAGRDAKQLNDSNGNFANPWGSSENPFSAAVSQRGFKVPVYGLRYHEPGLEEAYLQQWTLSYQRQLPFGMTLEAAYLGNRSAHNYRISAANPGELIPGATPFNVESRRRYPDFGAVSGYVSDGASSYNALQLRLNRRFASGFQFSTHYVWSKTLDNAGGAPPQIPMYADRDITPWARSNGDRRHQFVWYGSWDIPGWQKPIARWITSGWQAHGIIRVGSGQPFNLRNAFDSTLTGRPSGSPDLIGPYRKLNPRDLSTFTLPNGRTVTGNFFFDPSVFQTVLPAGPEEARLGNLGRNVFTGPGTNNVDFSLLKEIRIHEQHRLNIRLDALNVFNHTQFVVAYDSQFTNSPFFGQSAVQTAGPRQIQIYLRYSF